MEYRLRPLEIGGKIFSKILTVILDENAEWTDVCNKKLNGVEKVRWEEIIIKYLKEMNQ